MICKVSDLSDQVLYEFLSYCMSPVAERIETECSKYKTKTNRELYGIYLNNTLRGIIGLIRGESATELKHIAIHPEFRMQGLGSKLIEYVIKSTEINKLVVETDKDAVNFYKKKGFKIISLGEKYPGVERFKCEYSNNTL
ncbi:GNAT family N-acetyltransferase [Paenibacillus favisporus]|uniref:GNAT family N-acetyltransferase n=1 Tax=Paenibacillus favisporus TaxID=221028 RepID=UPI0013D3FAFB|nr:GNAT family N-acetyltransferase [Paenibacillus favisporus]